MTYFPNGLRSDGILDVRSTLYADDLTVRSGGTVTFENTTVLDSTTDYVVSTDLFFMLDCTSFNTIGGTLPKMHAGYMVQYDNDSLPSTDVIQDGFVYNFNLRLWTFVSTLTPISGSTVQTGSWYPERIELSNTSTVSDGLGGQTDSVLLAGDKQFTVFDLATRSMIFTDGITYDDSTKLFTTDAHLLHIVESSTASTDIVEIPMWESEIAFSDTTTSALQIIRGYDTVSYTTFDTESDELRLPANTVVSDGSSVGTIELDQAVTSGIAVVGTPITLGPKPIGLDVQAGSATIVWTPGNPTTLYTYYIPLDLDKSSTIYDSSVHITIHDIASTAKTTTMLLSTTSAYQIIPADAVPTTQSWGGTYGTYIRFTISEDQITKILNDAYAGVVYTPTIDSSIVLSYSLSFNRV